jgi:hypothetical protein
MTRRERRAQRSLERQEHIEMMKGAPPGPYLHEILDTAKRPGSMLESKPTFTTFFRLFDRLNAEGSFDQRDTVWRIAFNMAANMLKEDDTSAADLVRALDSFAKEGNIKRRYIAVSEVQAILARSDLTPEEREIFEGFFCQPSPEESVVFGPNGEILSGREALERIRDTGKAEQLFVKNIRSSLSPLAQSIISTLTHPDPESAANQAIVAQNHAALKALSIDERTAVMKEVSDARGFGLFPPETPSQAPARFLGKKDPRLCDRLLSFRARDKNEARELNDIRQAQKFVFDNDAIEKAFLAAKALSHKDLSLAVSDLRFPFRLSWFENEPFVGDEHISPHLREMHAKQAHPYFRRGFLIKTDETNQRGVFTFFSEANNRVDPSKINIFFDFTAEWDQNATGDHRDTIEQITGIKVLRTDNNNAQSTARVRNEYGPFISRFSPLSYPVTDRESGDIMISLMWDREIGQQLVAFLLILAMPKSVVEITKDDFVDYNKSRRRLGMHKSQRQEYHVVKVNKTTYEPNAEAAAIMARVRQERGEPQGGTHASPGVHNVRTHRRELRSGRVIWVKEHKRGDGPCRSKRAGYEVDDFPMMTFSEALAWLDRNKTKPPTVIDPRNKGTIRDRTGINNRG